MGPRRLALLCTLALVAGLVVAAPGPSTPATAQTGGDVGAAANTSGGEYAAITPTRILDTREGTGGLLGPRGVGQIDDVTATSIGTVVPNAASVAAVVLNVTVTDTTGSSYLTVWPSGEARSLASGRATRTKSAARFSRARTACSITCASRPSVSTRSSTRPIGRA